MVEDNLVNQLVIQELLENNDISVKIANHGREGLDILEQEDFDGVFLDCQMPVMDGYEMVRRLRLDQRWSKLPVIAATAHAMSGDRDKALAAGMDDYIAKPIDFDEVLSKVDQWMNPAGRKQGDQT